MDKKVIHPNWKKHGGGEALRKKIGTILSPTHEKRREEHTGERDAC